MTPRDWTDLVKADARTVWHPYASVPAAGPVYPVVSAEGVRIRLADGRELVDGMASWWSAIHGYNHPSLNAALEGQLASMAHVMFGGLTHEPAVRLAETLVGLAPPGLEVVFFADSGSVSVEIALKMAIQFQAAAGRPRRQRLVALRGGYHGDTLGAMSLSDPVTGMHAMFREVLPRHFFADRPAVRFHQPWVPADTASLEAIVEEHADEIAAIVLEPVVQGAGGMWFYNPGYLREARRIAHAHGLLLVADEIATGFGRTGRLFACEHADVTPDILCLGKALTGGYLTMAATLATRRVAEAISSGGPFMHGPTFMANPLAAAVATASVELLLSTDWKRRVRAIERQLTEELEPCRDVPGVRDVRVLGAIGVVELEEAVDMNRAPGEFVDRGVWVRPFGRLVYTMPPYVIEAADLGRVTRAIREVVAALPAPPLRSRERPNL
jgi:adenosylmethionine-8-amino-7-oxononanoate aminotransferase